MPNYLPPSQRDSGWQYSSMLNELVNRRAVTTMSKQGENVRAVAGLSMRFDMQHGAAVITERDISGFWRKGIGEICAFINGARTLDELKSFGCDWWGPWASEKKCSSRGLETGDLGPGSYGHAFRNFTTDFSEEGLIDRDLRSDEGFDQLPALIQKLKDLPDDRTALLSPWVPQANVRAAGVKSMNTIAPCHGWIHAMILNDKLHIVHNQRSGDVPVGVPSNMVQYSALGLMLEQLIGVEFAEYVHWIQYAHIYESQLPAANEMLSRGPLPLPTLDLTEAGKRVTDIHDFRAEHFELTDYNPHPAIKNIPVLT